MTFVVIGALRVKVVHIIEAKCPVSTCMRSCQVGPNVLNLE